MGYQVEIAGSVIGCDTVEEAVELILACRNQNGNVGLVKRYLEKSGAVHLVTIMRATGLTKGQTSYALKQGAAKGLFEQAGGSKWAVSNSKAKVTKR